MREQAGHLYVKDREEPIDSARRTETPELAVPRQSSERKKGVLRSLVSLWKWLRVWLTLWIIAQVGSLLALGVYDGATGQGVALLRVTSALGTAFFWGAALTYCNFVYRALKNYWAMNAEGIETSPAMGVACNFIPIFNLFGPYMVMTELWNVGAKFTEHARKPPAMFALWWLFWLLTFFGLFASAVLNAVIERQGVQADWSLYQWAVYVAVGTLFLQILSCIALFGVIKGVTRYHEASRILYERKLQPSSPAA